MTSWFVICWFPGDTREASGVCALLVIWTFWCVFGGRQGTIHCSIGKFHSLVGGVRILPPVSPSLWYRGCCKSVKLTLSYSQVLQWLAAFSRSWALRSNACENLQFDFFTQTENARLFYALWSFSLLSFQAWCSLFTVHWLVFQSCTGQLFSLCLCSPTAILPFVIPCPVCMEQTPSSPSVSSYHGQDDWCNEALFFFGKHTAEDNLLEDILKTCGRMVNYLIIQ